MTACTAPSGIDRAKLAGVYKASQDLKGATDVGVTLVRYRDLLGTFASQVAQARDVVSNDRERLMVDQYAFAAECYQDAAKVWAAKIEHEIDGRWIYLDKLADGPLFVKKYNLQVQHSPYVTDEQIIYPEAAIQEIWHRADQGLALANTAYTGKTE